MKKIYAIIVGLVLLSSCTKQYNYYTYVTNVDSVYTSYYYQTVLLEQQEITDDIRPSYLKKGDTIGVFALSNSVTQSELANGINTLKSWGLVVVEADNLYKQDGRYAGTQSERIEGFQKLLDNPNIKALISARGGYGIAQVLSFIDFSALEKNPKWIIGYSDVTGLHIALNNRGIETIHGPMAKDFSDAESVESLRKALFGELSTITVATNKNCIEGTAEGRLVGGNLSLIYSLGGTLFDLNVKNSILLIEDTGEANYAIDRMLANLKLSGKLDGIKGVVVGEFTNTSQGNDRPINEIIHNYFGDLNIPILYGVNIGHETKNHATYLGRNISLNIDSKEAKIVFKD
ncbi:MAG: LD-carboxypeptidase [Bacteroidales bacterium]|nr:LD-carboxypeptidase [Bacteroidales bacterium]